VRNGGKARIAVRGSELHLEIVPAPAPAPAPVPA